MDVIPKGGQEREGTFLGSQKMALVDEGDLKCIESNRSYQMDPNLGS